MPGFNLFINLPFSTIPGDKSLEFCYKSESINLSTVRSKNCRFESQEHTDYSIYFEGQVYNNRIEYLFDECLKLARKGTLHDLSQFVKTLDGEFVLILIDAKADKVFVLNDSFGRLPVYIFENQGKLLITRNIDLLIDVFKPSYDPIGLAQLLLFGYCLGTRTHFEAVRKMSPNGLLSIDLNPFSLKESSSFDVDLDHEEPELQSIEDELQNAFEIALSNRIKILGDSALALSGGLDSRYIAGVLKKLRIKIPLITYRDIDRSTDLDIESAKQIVEQLDLKDYHEFLQLSKCSESDLKEHARNKQGFNSLSMAFQLPFWKYFPNRGYTIITGDGGGKFFVDLSPLKKLKSQKQLLKYLLRFNAISTPKSAAKLAGITEDQLLNSITEEFDSYPYDDFHKKYIFFSIREGGINWAFEGEDRNRFYTWSTTPFYAPELVRLALKYPMSQKIYGGLYRKLYEKLPGKLNEVINPNWNKEPLDKYQVKKIHQRQALKMYLPKRLIWRKKCSDMSGFPEYQLLKKRIANQNESQNLGQLKGKNQQEYYWIILTLLLRKN